MKRSAAWIVGLVLVGLAGRAGWADPTAEDVVARINEYRKIAGVAPVRLDDKLSAPCAAHVAFLLKHDDRVWSTGTDRIDPHVEDRNLGGFSEAGHRAAVLSIIAWVEPVLAVDNHMEGHFHRVPLLNPELERVGIAFARGGRYGWACVFDVNSGLKSLPDRPPFLLWPVENQANVPTQYYNEMPDPIPQDPDKVAGNPVTAIFAPGRKVTDARGTLVEGKGGKPVDCWLSTPQQPASPTFQRNTICLFPKKPLRTKTLYTVTMEAVVDGEPWKRTWSFTTTSRGPSPRPHMR